MIAAGHIKVNEYSDHTDYIRYDKEGNISSVSTAVQDFVNETAQNDEIPENKLPDYFRKLREKRKVTREELARIVKESSGVELDIKQIIGLIEDIERLHGLRRRAPW